MLVTDSVPAPTVTTFGALTVGDAFIRDFDSRRGIKITVSAACWFDNGAVGPVTEGGLDDAMIVERRSISVDFGLFV
jgi:hypothetical protein